MTVVKEVQHHMAHGECKMTKVTTNFHIFIVIVQLQLNFPCPNWVLYTHMTTVCIVMYSIV